MVACAGLAAGILLAGPAAMSPASAGAARLVDGEGVVHFTNVPGDPRYRGLPGASGTAIGWLSNFDHQLGQYAKEIRDISVQYDVDPALVQAVIRVESGFNPSAVSRKGAGGLMQLMPRTASALGVSDRFDPSENIRGGVRHLRYLLDRYRGNVPVAIAAYNAGEGAVDVHRGVPPYPETEQYVLRVLQQVGASEIRAQSRSRLYRYSDSDNSLIFSNRPPGSLRPRPIVTP